MILYIDPVDARNMRMSNAMMVPMQARTQTLFFVGTNNVFLFRSTPTGERGARESESAIAIARGVDLDTSRGSGRPPGALAIGIIKRRLTWQGFWRVLVETGHITASILFLIIAASMYSRMLGVAALPTLFSDWLTGMDLGMAGLMIIYVTLMVVLGTIIETASIILIVVPLFLGSVEALGGDLVWFGIVTVIGAEIGLLTPPLGISCFTIKSTIKDSSITLSHIFRGAFPFAAIMLLVLILIVIFPWLSVGLL